MSSEDFYIGRTVLVEEQTPTTAFWLLSFLLFVIVIGIPVIPLMWGEGTFCEDRPKEYEISTHSNGKVLLKRKTIFGTKKLIVLADDLKTKSKYLLG